MKMAKTYQEKLHFRRSKRQLRKLQKPHQPIRLDLWKDGTVTGENGASGSCYKVLTFVKISWLLPCHIDVYCVKRNAFRGTSCAYTRPFANINIRTPTTPIPLNQQNFFARWMFKSHSGSYSTQLPHWPKISVMKFRARDSSKRFKTSTYLVQIIWNYIYIWNTYELREGASTKTAN